MRQVTLIAFFIFFYGKHFTQIASVKYQLPMSNGMEISASFGDIRPNHFHTGIDFRTNGKTGLPIKSIDKGYVGRIKILPLSYGQVIYINHPDGITSVYAHCSKFNARIEKEVLKYQKLNQLNEIDWHPEDTIWIERGETIAFSGNTGNSTGPHLHFELRETHSDKALNPLKHGFSYIDSKAPIPTAIYFYNVDENGYQINQNPKKVNVVASNTGYSVAGNKVVLDTTFFRLSPYYIIGIQAKDPIGNVGTLTGLYEQKLTINNLLYFHCITDTIAFEHNGYMNDYCDFNSYENKSTKIHKLFFKKVNPLELYKSPFKGPIQFTGKATNVQIELIDVNKNRIQIKFEVSGALTKKTYIPIFNEKEYLIPNKTYLFENANAQMQIGDSTLLEPVTKKNQLLLNTGVQFKGKEKALNEPYIVKLKPLSDTPMEKQYIQCINAAGIKSPCISKLESTWFVTKTSKYGTYNVVKDLIKPSVKCSTFARTDSIISLKNHCWLIGDNESGIFSYNFYIDGKWVPVYYDKKNAWIELSKSNIPLGKHDFQITVADQCKNTFTWKKKLTVIK